MYVISLDENQEIFYPQIHNTLDSAIGHAADVNRTDYAKSLKEFHIGALEPLTYKLYEFKEEFSAKFNLEVENFIFDKVLDITGIDEDRLSVSHKNKYVNSNLLEDFFGEYIANLDIKPQFIIRDTFTINITSCAEKDAIQYIDYFNIPNDNITICHVKLKDNRYLVASCPDIKDAELAKMVAYSNAISNLRAGIIKDEKCSIWTL